MPDVHAYLASTSANPSTLATVLIALSSAVVGGAIAGVTQWLIEGRRARHERELDAERAQRADADAQRAASNVAMVAARLMIDDFRRTVNLWKVEIANERWMISALSRMRMRVTQDERRALAEHLDAVAWKRVAVAESQIEMAESMRDVQREQQIPEFVDRDRGTLQRAVPIVETAIDALRPLAEEDVQSLGSPTPQSEGATPE